MKKYIIQSTDFNGAKTYYSDGLIRWVTNPRDAKEFESSYIANIEKCKLTTMYHLEVVEV